MSALLLDYLAGVLITAAPFRSFIGAKMDPGSTDEARALALLVLSVGWPASVPVIAAGYALRVLFRGLLVGIALFWGLASMPERLIDDARDRRRRRVAEKRRGQIEAERILAEEGINYQPDAYPHVSVKGEREIVSEYPVYTPRTPVETGRARAIPRPYLALADRARGPGITGRDQGGGRGDCHRDGPGGGEVEG